jgi:predicted  nucleic acid-binding Zn-ribbon protein
MPHQCTSCGHTFADGSKEMLSGCPECGGTKFQFHPGAAPAEPTDENPPDRDAGAVGRAADAVRNLVSADTEADADADVSAGGNHGDAAGGEDPAQASARSDVVDATDLPPVEDRAPDDGPGTGSGADPGAEPTDTGNADPEGPVDPDESPDLSELREELNAQFESIKIVEPGQYELNLMELYDREEYIIALQENGRYVIEVADTWREGDADDR